ncbi:PepSY-associated TM helix domain-containing protein [Acidobacteriota bacterium]
MKWRKWNNILHRDLGYLFFGITIIYVVSGIALNHKHEWNPNYVLNKQKVNINPVRAPSPLTEEIIGSIVEEMGFTSTFKSSFQPNPDTLQIFLEEGNIILDLKSGNAELENIKERRIFKELNYLHINGPRRIWTYVSDIYALILAILAVTGLFVLKGKNGIRGRGKWLTLLGIIIPIIFLLIYL